MTPYILLLSTLVFIFSSIGLLRNVNENKDTLFKIMGPFAFFIPGVLTRNGNLFLAIAITSVMTAIYCFSLLESL